ncbi:MAG: FHA domain-containing protein [Candidatus Krumholzibacteriota bacterium]|nr:FHA domain-containing protein [Candidatus Krumholzibacteriota bacterium]
MDTPPGGSRPVAARDRGPAAPAGGTRAGAGPAAQTGLVAWLVMTRGARRGQDWRLPSRAVRIGKAPDCEIALPEEGYLSAHHAELAFDGTRFVVRDLGSTNGTAVNDRRVEVSPLEDGDRLVLGLTQFVFKCLRL